MARGIETICLWQFVKGNCNDDFTTLILACSPGVKKLVAVWKCNNQIIPHRRSCYEYRSTRTTIGFLVVSVKTEDIGTWTAELYDLNTLESRSRLPYEFAVQVSRGPGGRSSNEHKKLNAARAVNEPIKQEAVNRSSAVPRNNDTKAAIKSSFRSEAKARCVNKEELKPKTGVRESSGRITDEHLPKPSCNHLPSKSAVKPTFRNLPPCSKTTGGPSGIAGQVNVRQCRQESFVRPSLTSTTRQKNASTLQPKSKVKTAGATSQDQERSVRWNATPAIVNNNRSTAGYKQNSNRSMKVSNAANLNRNQSSKIPPSPAAEKEQLRRQPTTTTTTTTSTSLYPRPVREPSSAALVVKGRANAVNNVVNNVRQDVLSSSDTVKSNSRNVHRKQSSERVPAASATTVLLDSNTDKQVQSQQVPNNIQTDPDPVLKMQCPNKPEVLTKAKSPDPSNVTGPTSTKVRAGGGKISDLINRFNNGQSTSAANSATSEAEKPKPDRRPVGKLTMPKFTKEDNSQAPKTVRDYKPKVKLITSLEPSERNSGDCVFNVEKESTYSSEPAKVIEETQVPEANHLPLVPEQAKLISEETTVELEPTEKNNSSVLEIPNSQEENQKTLGLEEQITYAIVPANLQETQCSPSSSIEVEITEPDLLNNPVDVHEFDISTSADCTQEPDIPIEVVKQNFPKCPEVSSKGFIQPIVDLNGNETCKIVEEPVSAAPEPETEPFTPIPIPAKEPAKAGNDIQQQRIHIVAKLGERVELTTLSDVDDSAEIAPDQEIEWRLPNKQVTAGERNLVLENVSFVHSGKYEAVICKRRGSVLRKTFSLNVEGKLSFFLYMVWQHNIFCINFDYLILR